MQHNGHILQGRPWGGFLEVRTNAASSYLENYEREARYARKHRNEFSIFLSSATDPFLPQEARFGITRSVLTAMLQHPPDGLIVQTHSQRVVDFAPLCEELSTICDLRVHVSIETDREQIPGLPPHASSVEHRLNACDHLKSLGINTVVTVSPLLPIEHPDRFFARIANVAHAVVIDHFIQGDGSPAGSRTLRTPLPGAMQALLPESTSLAYRDKMAEIARRHLPGCVGVSIDGFAGRFMGRD